MRFPPRSCGSTVCLRRAGTRRGFALLITITLVAFLVLVLVSLSTFTRVETQVARNTQQFGVARQNALMALQVAVGELQRHAGPDQRITGRADLLTSYVGSPAAASGADQFDAFWSANRNRHWTGVWGNQESRIGYDLRPDEINGGGMSPLLLNWLVSGNEGAGFSVASNGQVSGATSPSITPDTQVAGLDAASTPASVLSFPSLTDPVTGDPRVGVMLVGPRSVSDGQSAGQLASFNAGSYVVAPAVTITAPAGAIPGLGSGTTPTPVGRYAWWVGDEGVKARVNLQPGHLATGAPADRINSFLVSQRSASEFMDADHAGTQIGAALNATDPATAGRISRIETLAQLPFVASEPVLPQAARNRFHDLSAHSHGVLSDAYAGGLKKDLTADIADTSGATGYRPANNAPIFTPLTSGEANLPTWGHLRSWARTQPAGGGVDLAPASDTQAGVHPFPSWMSLGFDAYVEQPSNQIRFAFFPAIYLTNPYSFTLNATRIEFGFKFPAVARLEFQVASHNPLDPDSPPADSAFSPVGSLHLGDATLRLVGSGDAPGSEFISFTVEMEALPPGTTHVYRLAPALAGTAYTPGVLLTRAPNSGPIGATNHLVLPTAIPLEAGVDGEDFLRLRRVSVGTNDDYITAAIAQPGTLGSTGDPQPGWYKGVSARLGARGAGGTNTSFLIRFRPEEQKIDSGWGSVTERSRAAMRMGSPYEARGAYWSNPDRAGVRIPRKWIAAGNFNAPFIQQTERENSLPNLYGTTAIGAVLHNDDEDESSGRDVTFTPMTSGYGSGSGARPDWRANGARTVIFDLLESSERLLSLGQLQHVPFSRYSFYPPYPFGNSMADVRVPRANTYYPAGGVVPRPGGSGALDPAYDLSWHLNRALWDRYFISGVPASLTQSQIDAGAPLPNHRLTYYARDGAAPALEEIRRTPSSDLAYSRAAANLLVAGGFNINSTSEQAWRALLASPAGLPADSAYADAGDNIATNIPYPRFSRNLSQPTAQGLFVPRTNTMVSDSSSFENYRLTLYHGNRGLLLNDPLATSNTQAQAVVAELARTIVREIRARGPFLSLADFVNRPLTASNNPAGIKGALQRAIDTMEPANGQVNPVRWLDSALNGVSTPSAVTSRLGTNWDLDHYYGGAQSEFGSGRDVFSILTALAPKYLTQADLLSTLGPLLSARSDTFTIRTYGEALNPVTGESEGRAWCEAVVQRLPDYLDSSMPADTDLRTAPASAAKSTNETFGRRFAIVSFRWLSADDI